MDTLWSMWNNTSMKLPNTCYTIKGFSIAALRTNFYIPELKLMLDAGLSANLSPDCILITHNHSDHVANVAYHLYMVNKKIPIFVPPESLVRLDRKIKSDHLVSADIDNDDISHITKLYELIPAYDGLTEIIVGQKEEIDKDGILKLKGGKPMKMEIIKCDHSVPSIGFGLIEKRLKLKEEYKHLQGREIGALKKSGVDINFEEEFPFFCYLGDTSPEVLKDPRLEKYMTLMIECTFILPEDHDQSVYTKHMHWEYLKPYVLSHPAINFILYHFSQRYKPEQIKEFFDKEFIDANIINVNLWISK
jgi:ribonuclease Z